MLGSQRTVWPGAWLRVDIRAGVPRDSSPVETGRSGDGHPLGARLVIRLSDQVSDELLTGGYRSSENARERQRA